jgi:hypothetical protein
VPSSITKSKGSTLSDTHVFYYTIHSHKTILYNSLQNLNFAAPSFSVLIKVLVLLWVAGSPSSTLVFSLFSLLPPFFFNLLIVCSLFQDENCFSLFFHVKVDTVNYIWCSIIWWVCCQHQMGWYAYPIRFKCWFYFILFF